MSDSEGMVFDPTSFESINYSGMVMMQINRVAIAGSNDLWNVRENFNKFRMSVQILESLLCPYLENNKDFDYITELKKIEKEETEGFYRKKFGLLMKLARAKHFINIGLKS